MKRAARTCFCFSAIFAVALAGCAGEFEDPSIVLDTRILAISLEPPERLVDLEGIDRPTPATSTRACSKT